MKRQTLRVKNNFLIGLALIVAVGAVSSAAAPSFAQVVGDEGVIRACYREVGVTQKILMLVIADPCEAGWTSIEWNQTGLQGDPGPEGPPGPLGATGPAGTSLWSESSGQLSTTDNVKADVSSGIAIWGDSTTRGVVGTLGGSCPGAPYAVGGCAGNEVGVQGWSGSGTAIRAQTTSGNIFTGHSPAQGPEGPMQVRISSSGRGYFNGGFQTGGADFAESILTTDDPSTLSPGDVLILDPQHPLAVRKSEQAESPLVAGVYSTQPALLAIGEHDIVDSLDGEIPVAIVGIVPTKVTTENGPIQIGDLLVTSSVPGHAMKFDPDSTSSADIYPFGVILGKAMEPLETGRGVIRILLLLR